MKKKGRIQAFVNVIWSWYSYHKRTLPWRDLPDQDATSRAYKILVSEIMLQQTQVPRVIVTYRNFLERFPAINNLADASNKEVLMAWRGMGYNSRALRLRDAARKIVGDSNGSFLRDFVEPGGSARSNEVTKLRTVFPSSMDELMKIPGIGHYTAAAIRNFAFNLATPCIDTNIRRILHRTFVGPEYPDGSSSRDDQYILKIAEDVLHEAIRHGTTADWHAALMDFGSLVQTKRSPKWDVCPLTREGIMKTTQENFELRIPDFGKSSFSQSAIRNQRKEPGRLIGATFIPNRIFRGRVIEALRDAPRGLTLHDIGRQIALDWDPAEHHDWLKTILAQLTRESMLGVKKGRYVLG